LVELQGNQKEIIQEIEYTMDLYNEYRNNRGMASQVTYPAFRNQSSNAKHIESEEDSRGKPENSLCFIRENGD